MINVYKIICYRNRYVGDYISYQGYVLGMQNTMVVMVVGGGVGGNGRLGKNEKGERKKVKIVSYTG